jgi:uncharacterized phage infection (PIP) family protein YhgE
MSFKTSLLKAFGFSSVEDDDYDEMSDLPSALPLTRQSPRDSVVEPLIDEGVVADAPTTTESQAPSSDDDCNNFPLTIFDGLLKVFNDAQPDFIKKCLDIEAQRRYLYNSIDSSFKEYMAQFQDQARVVADRRHDHILKKIDSETADLRRQLDAANKSLEEAKEQNMSAVRQRRAFNDRIRDLEQQVEAEKAEKDQYALETKSLLNKLKVAQVQTAGSDADTAEEIDRLRRSLDEMKSRLDSAEAERQELSRRVDEKQKELDDALAELQKAKETKITVAFEPQPVPDPTQSEPEKPAVDEAPKEEPVAPRRRQRKPRRSPKVETPAISAIDDTLDTTEWLIPTPPAGASKSASAVSDAEFGYHEPTREEPPLSDAQLSLFD